MSFLQWTVNVSVLSINWFVFQMEANCVLCKVKTESYVYNADEF